jgi:HD superfamily phosphohydrolase
LNNQKTNKLKIINDPIYGFITIPNSLIFDIIEHPYFQRLRRVTQMGLSNMVYPGANHTRFHHAIGCMHLMQKAVYVLRNKNVAISDDEANALYIAILLHDEIEYDLLLDIPYLIAPFELLFLTVENNGVQ